MAYLSRDQIKSAIVEALKGAQKPLKAQGILDIVKNKNGWRGLDKSTINSILYSELRNKVRQDANYRWALTDGPSSVPPPQSASNTSRPSPPKKQSTPTPSPKPVPPSFQATPAPAYQPPLPPPQNRVSPQDFPRRIFTDASSQDRQVKWLECAAAPRQAVKSLYSQSISENYLKGMSQWKLDLPIAKLEQVVTSPAAWVHVVEKILSRGRLVAISPNLERALLEVVGMESIDAVGDWNNPLSQIACVNHHFRDTSGLFDSAEEEKFSKEILPALGAHLNGWIERQITIGSLTGNATDEAGAQRVDFVLAHPDGLELVVEVDGTQHQDHMAVDQERDRVLSAAGFDVLRIAAHEIRDGIGDGLNKLKEKVEKIPSRPIEELDPVALLMLLSKRAQQIQVSLVQAIALGLIDCHQSEPIRVCCLLDSRMGGFEQNVFVHAVIEDLNELIADLAGLYGEETVPLSFALSDKSEADWIVDLAGGVAPIARNVLQIIDCYLPVSFANTISSTATVSRELTPRSETCERLLYRIFGFEEFLEGQFEAVERSLLGDDTIVLLPTGSGKSAAFQLAALLLPGICLVIDPILSLIEDQIENLRQAGIDRVAQITSAFTGEERQKIIETFARGEYLFCYIAPERLQDINFRESLRELTSHIPMALVAIDEAHCVSEWGHDFRPAYLNIARTCRDYGRSGSGAPPIMALTATASRSVLKDIQRELEIHDFEAVITPSSFDRKELIFKAIACRSDEKKALLKGMLQALPRDFQQDSTAFFSEKSKATMSGLVFCPHVNGDFGVASIAGQVGQMLGKKVPFYSGSSPKYSSVDWSQQKRKNARAFKQNQTSLMVCTKAFGMGIDKPNVRYTLHYCLPPSIESFYQEAGRAGRDRKQAFCSLLFSNDFPERSEKLLDPNTSLETVKTLCDNLPRSEADDITRVLWFHTNSFGGADIDFDLMCKVLEDIGSIESARDVRLLFGAGDERLQREKAIHRLLTIGVVIDYTISHSSKEFTVRLAHPSNENVLQALYQYIAAYQRERAQVAVERVRSRYDLEMPYGQFIRQVGRELIDFIYEVVESSRRHALFEMLSACTNNPDNEGLRQRILNYLESSMFSENIIGVIEGDSGGIEKALQVVEEIRSSIDANQVRGESGRELASYPDHPGLRLLRGISEAICVDPDTQAIADNIEACIRFAVTDYGIEQNYVDEKLLDVARMLSDGRPEFGKIIIASMIKASADKRKTSRLLIRNLSGQSIEPAIACLVKEVSQSLEQYLES
jgi:ATP-dependent DNA helicase RecQ